MESLTDKNEKGDSAPSEKRTGSNEAGGTQGGPPVEYLVEIKVLNQETKDVVFKQEYRLDDLPQIKRSLLPKLNAIIEAGPSLPPATAAKQSENPVPAETAAGPTDDHLLKVANLDELPFEAQSALAESESLFNTDDESADPKEACNPIPAVAKPQEVSESARAAADALLKVTDSIVAATKSVDITDSNISTKTSDLSDSTVAPAKSHEGLSPDPNSPVSPNFILASASSQEATGLVLDTLKTENASDRTEDASISGSSLSHEDYSALQKLERQKRSGWSENAFKSGDLPAFADVELKSAAESNDSSANSPEMALIKSIASKASASRPSKRTMLSATELDELNKISAKNEKEEGIISRTVAPEEPLGDDDDDDDDNVGSGSRQYKESRIALGIGAAVTCLFAIFVLPLLNKPPSPSTVSGSSANVAMTNTTADVANTNNTGKSTAHSSASTHPQNTPNSSAPPETGAEQNQNSAPKAQGNTYYAGNANPHGTPNSRAVIRYTTPDGKMPSGKADIKKELQLARWQLARVISLAAGKNLDLAAYRHALELADLGLSSDNPSLDLVSRLAQLADQLSRKISTSNMVAKAAPVNTTPAEAKPTNEPSFTAQRGQLSNSIVEAQKEGLDTQKYTAALKSVQQDINFRQHPKDLAVKMQSLNKELSNKIVAKEVSSARSRAAAQIDNAKENQNSPQDGSNKAVRSF